MRLNMRENWLREEGTKPEMVRSSTGAPDKVRAQSTGWVLALTSCI